MSDVFLIDECLSRHLAAYAKGVRNINAEYLFREDFPVGREDRVVLRFAAENNYAFVTCKGKDLVKLSSQMEVRPRLVLLLPGPLKVSEQIRFFGRALDAIEQRGLIDKSSSHK